MAGSGGEGLLAQRYERAGTHLYAVAIPLHLVATFLPVPDPDQPFTGNRRVSRAHAQGFAEYWAGTHRWVVPPLLVDTPQSLAAYFTPLADAGDLVAGALRLPGPERTGVQILDGQHRVLGWSLLADGLAADAVRHQQAMDVALKRGTSSAFQDAFAALQAVQVHQKRMREEAVTVEILERVDLDEHKQYFFDIAANAKGISRSLTAGFDKREVLHRVAQDLAEEHVLLAGRVDMENDRVSGESANLMSLRNVVDVVTAATIGINGWISAERARALTDDGVRAVAEEALGALLETFDDVADVAEGNLRPADLRRSSLLGSVTMLRVLAGSYHMIAVRGETIHPDADRVARKVFTMLAPEMGLPVSDLWWASRAFPSRESRAPASRRQDLTELVRFVGRIAARVAEVTPPLAPARVPPAPAGPLAERPAHPAPRTEVAPPEGDDVWSLDDIDDDGPGVLPEGRLTADPVKDYLKAIGRHSLLSGPEEVALAKRIEAGVLARERLETTPVETRALRRELTLLAVEGDEARAAFIQANLRLVVSIAKRYAGHGLEFLDLIQEGNIGLIRAVEKFDWREGNKFSTYATWWVRQAITRGLADQGRVIRLPVHFHETVVKLRGVIRGLQDETGGAPSLDEVALQSGMSVDDVRGILHTALPVFSLDADVRAVGDEWRDGEWNGHEWVVPLGRVIVDSLAVDPSEAAQRAVLREDLLETLASLTDREAGIIAARFGFLGEPQTLDEIGKVYRVTRERIRQLEVKALRKLRHPSRSDRLRGYLDNPDARTFEASEVEE